MPAWAARSPMRLYSSAARFTSSMVGFLGPSRLGTSICVRPTSFAQADAAVLILPQFIHGEVTADAGQPCLLQDASQFGSLVFAEAAESGVGISHRRAQLDRLESGCGKHP